LSYAQLFKGLGTLQNFLITFSDLNSKNKKLTSEILLIDEAHNFRNFSTVKRENLVKKYFYERKWDEYIFDETESMEERIPESAKIGKSTLLITATPISNSEKDLINIIELFGVKKDRQLNTLEHIGELFDKQWDILKFINKNNKTLNVCERELREYINFFFNRLNKKEKRYDKSKEPKDYYFPRIANIGDEYINPCILSQNENAFHIWLDKYENNVNISDTSKHIKKFSKWIDNVCKEEVFGLRGKSLLKIILYCSLDSSIESLIKTVDSSIEKIENCYKLSLEIGFDQYEKNRKLLNIKEIVDDDNSDSEEIYEYEVEGNKSNYYCLTDFLKKHHNLDSQNKWKKYILEDWKNLKEQHRDKKENSISIKYHYLKFLFDKSTNKIDNSENRKTIIFTQRKLTVKYLAKWISEEYNDFHLRNGEGIIAASSEGFDIYYRENDQIKKTYCTDTWHYENNEDTLNIVKKLFSPIANSDMNDLKYINHPLFKKIKEKNINFKFLITTNIFAEGHNLQDATILVNFDAHYNPTVTLQRIGRVDRFRDYVNKFKDDIYNEVFIFNLYTNPEIMEVITTYDKQKSKTKLADVLGSDSHKFYIPRHKVNEYENQMEVLVKEMQKLQGEELTDVIQLHKPSQENIENIKNSTSIKYRFVNSEKNGFIIKYSTFKTYNKQVIYIDDELNPVIWPDVEVFNVWNDKLLKDLDISLFNDLNFESLNRYRNWMLKALIKLEEMIAKQDCERYGAAKEIENIIFLIGGVINE
ncbi:MAG: helicase-related protein, partial [Mycoplasma sp.]